MPDRIEETLRNLSRDIDAVPLPDSGAVRRRGDQRTRHQVVGAGIAAVAVLAGVAGLAGGLPGRTTSAPPATNAPTVATTQEPLHDLAAQPFLTTDQLTGFGGYDQAGPFVDAETAPEVLPEQCPARPGSWGATEVRSTRYYQDGSEASIHEYVLRFTNSADAEAGAARLGEEMSDCPVPAYTDGALTQRGEPVAGVASGYHGSRFFVPNVASETSYYEVATARRANVVVVLEWLGSGSPTGDVDTDWVWTAERLQTALDRATG